jgi:hypothetical protein
MRGSPTGSGGSSIAVNDPVSLSSKFATIRQRSDRASDTAVQRQSPGTSGSTQPVQGGSLPSGLRVQQQGFRGNSSIIAACNPVESAVPVRLQNSSSFESVDPSVPFRNAVLLAQEPGTGSVAGGEMRFVNYSQLELRRNDPSRFHVPLSCGYTAQQIGEFATNLLSVVCDGSITIKEIVVHMQNWAKCVHTSTNFAVYCCMAQSVFEDCCFYPQYPPKILMVLAEVFGRVIAGEVIRPSTITLMMRLIVESLRLAPTHVMFHFGLAALKQLMEGGALHRYPQFTTHLFNVDAIRELLPAQHRYFAVLLSSIPPELRVQSVISREHFARMQCPPPPDCGDIDKMLQQFTTYDAAVEGSQVIQPLLSKEQVEGRDRSQPLGAFPKAKNPPKAHPPNLIGFPPPNLIERSTPPQGAPPPHEAPPTSAPPPAPKEPAGTYQSSAGRYALLESMYLRFEVLHHQKSEA